MLQMIASLPILAQAPNVVLTSPTLGSTSCGANCDEYEGCTGISITLTASRAVAPDEYRWYLDGSPTPVHVGATYTFTLSASTAGDYTARAVDASIVSADSDVIRLISTAPPTGVAITSPSTSFCTSGSITLTANATGSGITFRWYRDKISNPTPIATGVNTLNVSTAGKYSIEAQSSCGVVSSSEVEITEAGAAPNILGITPEDVTNRLCFGGSFKLTGNLSSTAGVTYQWYLNNLSTPIPGATNIEYTATMAGNYILEATNGCGSIQTSSNVLIQTPPTGVNITSSTTETCDGSIIILENFVTGSDFTKVEWYKDGVLWKTVEPYNKFEAAEETGTYKAKVFNKCGGSVFSNEVSVIVIIPPTSANISFDTSPSLGCGVTSVRLYANSNGDPSNKITYEWYREGDGLLHTGDFYDAVQIGKYTIRAIADNSCGEIFSEVLEVTEATDAPTIISLTANPTTTCEGATLLTASSDGDNLSYEWYRGGTLLAKTTENTYTATETGSYRVRASNACGSTPFTSLIPIAVYNTGILPPTITLSNGSNSACEGGGVPLQANASVSIGIVYRWFRNGRIIQDATNDTYVATTSGSYVVEVADGTCSQLSNPQEVFINSVPTVLVRYAGSLEFCEGDSTIFYASSEDNSLEYEWLIVDDVVGTGNIYIAKEAGAYQLVLRAKTTCGASREFYNELVVTPKAAPNVERVGSRLEVTEISDFYQWRKNDVPIIGANNKSYIPIDSGTYSVVLTNRLGCVRISEEITFEGFSQSSDNIQITPNPSDGAFQMSIMHEGEAKVVIHKISGELVYEQTFEKTTGTANQHSVIIQNLSRGLYVVRVEADGKVTSEKIIIQ